VVNLWCSELFLSEDGPGFYCLCLCLVSDLWFGFDVLLMSLASDEYWFVRVELIL